jgi:aryl-alcohol dehydrogenase-like predicted oxidoreductase
MSRVKQLCFGTAKVGMPWYGLGSVSRPNVRERMSLVRMAVDVGIPWLDTGSAYGDAEHYIEAGAVSLRDVRVVTKLAPHFAAQAMRYVEWLHPDAALLHNPSEAQLADAGFMEEWKDVCANVPARAGASVYDPVEVDAVSRARLTVVQAPFSLLDTRSRVALKCASLDGLMTFARCPFAQGILTNGEYRESGDPADDTAADVAARFYGRILEPTCRHYGVTPVEAALWYALDESGADYVVFGAGSLAHLEEVVAAADRVPLDGWGPCKAELEAGAAGTPTVAFGSLWRAR